MTCHAVVEDYVLPIMVSEFCEKLVVQGHMASYRLNTAQATMKRLRDFILLSSPAAVSATNIRNADVA